jgi:hypothetical protein
MTLDQGRRTTEEEGIEFPPRKEFTRMCRQAQGLEAV